MMVRWIEGISISRSEEASGEGGGRYFVRCGMEVGVCGGVGVAVSGDDDVVGEPDNETGGNNGVGEMRQVICICPYVPIRSVRMT